MYFNPISYFLKSFIRLFTKKFFWILLILIFVCIGWVLFNTEVSAQDTFNLQIPGFDFTYYNIPHITDQFVITVDYYQGQSWILFYDNSVVDFLYDNTTRFNDGGRDSNGNIMTTTAVYRTYNNTSWEQLGNGQYYEDLLVQHIRYNTMPIVYPNGSVYRAADPNPFYVTPYFITTEQEIQNWNFDFLEISGGNVPYYTTSGGTTPIFGNTYLELTLTYNYVNYDIDISQFIIPDYDNNTWSIKIPKNYLFNYVNVQNNIDFKFTLYAEQQYPFKQYSVETNNMTFDLTAEQLAQINSDTDKQIQGSIVQQQQQIQNTLTDTSVPPDSDFALPTIEVNDTTSNFFDTLFTGIYNAFNTTEDVSINFTIFSQNITINSSDFRMLNDNRFTILRNLLESSWYFAIGYMILKDIRHIFDKIKTGNIENAVSNDIKADMV